MRLKLLLTSSVLMVGVCAGSSVTFANARKIAEFESEKLGRAANKCAETKQGQPLIDCVGQALSSMSVGLNRGLVPKYAATAPSLAAQAAAVSGKPKAQATAVLNKVIAVSRSLAVKGNEVEKDVYNTVAGAFSVALAVVERKG